MRLLIAFICPLFISFGCINNTVPNEDSDLNGSIIFDEKLQNEIKVAPSEILIDGVAYKAEAYIWRDFAPSLDHESSLGLMSLNKLIRIDKEEIPSYVELKQQYVINGNSIWAPNYEEEDRPRGIPYLKEEISRHGPSWKVDTELNVGVKILDKRTNKEYLILIPKVTINATH